MCVCVFFKKIIFIFKFNTILQNLVDEAYYEVVGVNLVNDKMML